MSAWASHTLHESLSTTSSFLHQNVVQAVANPEVGGANRWRVSGEEPACKPDRFFSFLKFLPPFLLINSLLRSSAAWMSASALVRVWGVKNTPE